MVLQTFNTCKEKNYIELLRLFKTKTADDLVIESSDEEEEEEEEVENELEDEDDEIETQDNTIIEIPKITSQPNKKAVSNTSKSLSMLSFFSRAKSFIISKKFLLPTIFLGALYFLYFKQRR